MEIGLPWSGPTARPWTNWTADAREGEPHSNQLGPMPPRPTVPPALHREADIYWNIVRAVDTSQIIPEHSLGESYMQDLARKVKMTGFALFEGYQPERSAAEVVSGLGEAETLGNTGAGSSTKAGVHHSSPFEHLQRQLWAGHLPTPYRHGSLARSTTLSDTALPAGLG
jgi:hypothetical protein